MFGFLRVAPKLIGTLVLAMLCLALLLGLAACGGDGLVGTWEEPDGSVTEFTADGKVLVDDAMVGEIEGTYEVEGDLLTVKAMGMELTFKYSVDGDALTMESSEGVDITTMTRVK